MANKPITQPLRHTAVGLWTTILTDGNGDQVGHHRWRTLRLPPDRYQAVLRIPVRILHTLGGCLASRSRPLRRPRSIRATTLAAVQRAKVTHSRTQPTGPAAALLHFNWRQNMKFILDSFINTVCIIAFVVLAWAFIFLLPAQASAQDVNPETGQEYAVSDQDLKNGMASVLEFVAHGFEVSGDHDAKNYLMQVARNIASGRGQPAPSPGPVTPTTTLLGAAQAQDRSVCGPAEEPIGITSDGDGFSYTIHDAEGTIIGSAKSYVVVYKFYDHRGGGYREIGGYASFDNMWHNAQNYFRADHCG